jgi:hypothetical protein
MSASRVAAGCAWVLWAICVALVALAVLLVLNTPPVPARGGPNLDVLAAVPFLTYATVGAFVASRRPENAVGWLLCGMGLVFAFHAFAGAYADYALVARPGSLPGGVVMLWVSTGWLSVPGMLLGVVLLILLFPDGRPPNRGLWTVAWMAVGGATLGALSSAVSPGPMNGYEAVPNPFGVSRSVDEEVMWPLAALGVVVLLISWVASVISLHLRLDGARGAEREQIKWFAYAAALLLFGVFVGFPAADAMGGPWANFVLLVTGFSLLPLAVGFAIFRHHLYDVNVVVNRTLVYGALTAILAGIYFGGVTATQAILQTLTGQQELPQLAIVASTLVIAALFSPLRRRLQGFIDKRFYRRKYDARKILEAFSARLRNETDLDALRDEVIRVVRNTMQPEHASLWLRTVAQPHRRANNERTSQRTRVSR